ncbi:MAG: LCP family protein [Chloroflexi bacterium]|nr:LCP family protein [Chloroflexota bacterium]
MGGSVLYGRIFAVNVARRGVDRDAQLNALTLQADEGTVQAALPGMPITDVPELNSGTIAWRGKGRANILLLGVDRRPQEAGEPARSDAMDVVSLDPQGKKATLLSIPRDLWVAIPDLARYGITEDRINAALFYGDYYQIPGGGPALAKKTVSLNLGLPIHYYVLVDFQGFVKAIDLLGGVDLELDAAIVDDEYPTDDYGTMQIHIPAGRQHLDGQRALQYARTRHMDNDFGRIRRQQKLLLAVREKALGLDVVAKVPALLGTLKDSFSTDLGPADILALAQAAKDVAPQDITTCLISESMVTFWATDDGSQVLVPRREAISKLIQENFFYRGDRGERRE